MSVDITDCRWPIPDETSTTGHIVNCLNFQWGCWQCTTQDGLCWCYMAPKWKQHLELGEVKVKYSLIKLKKRIHDGFQLQSNLGMSSSHDPLHDACIGVTRHILEFWDQTDLDIMDAFWNGHKLHIVTKRPTRVLALIDVLPTDQYGEWPRVWCSITTPDQEQSEQYLRHAESPFDMQFALNSLHKIGFEDLGVSFGPCFGAWRDTEVAESYLRELPPLHMAQFEKMNHGKHDIDVLTEEEVSELAHQFKAIQPHSRVFLKDGAYSVGTELELEEVTA